MQPRDKVLAAAIQRFSYGPMSDAVEQLKSAREQGRTSPVESDDTGLEYSVTQSAPPAQDVCADIDKKQQELDAREKKLRQQEEQTQARQAQLDREARELEQDKRRAEKAAEQSRIRQQAEDAARAKQRAIENNLSLARIEKSLVLADKNNLHAYDAVIYKFRRILEDLGSGNIVDIKNAQAISVCIEIADCYALQGDFIAAYKELNRLNTYANIFNPLPAHVKTVLDNYREKIIAVCDKYSTELQRALQEDDPNKAREYLAKIKPMYAAIEYSGAASKIAALNKKIEWHGLKNSTNNFATKLLASMAEVDSFYNGSQFTYLIDSLENTYITYGNYKDHLDEHEYQLCRNLGSALQDVKNKHKKFELKAYWHANRERFNTIFAKYQNLQSDAEKYSYDYHIVMAELNSCAYAYLQHLDFLSAEESNNHSMLGEILEFARVKQQAQIKYEQRITDRERNKSTEQRIKSNLLDVKSKIIRGDIPGAYDLLRSLQNAARTINYPEDVTDANILQPEYFTPSLDILHRELSYFNSRAETNSNSCAKSVIKVALEANTLGVQPTLFESDLKMLANSLSADLRSNWIKFDRRGFQDTQNFFNGLSEVIRADLIANSVFTRWNPLYWTNACMRLKDMVSLNTKLANLIKAYQPRSNPQYIELPLFAEEVPVATVVVPPEPDEQNIYPVVPKAKVVMKS